MSATETETQSLGGFSQLLANRDVVFALGVVAILGMLFVPLPPILLDFGLAISLSLAMKTPLTAMAISTVKTTNVLFQPSRAAMIRAPAPPRITEVR